MNKEIIFFDGDCMLCNKALEVIVRQEKDHQLYFSALQSNFAKEFLKDYTIPDTLVYSDGENIYFYSKAVLKISKHLKAPYSWINLLKLLPYSFLDIGYRFIAKHRRKFFKKRETCLFLDKNMNDRILE